MIELSKVLKANPYRGSGGKFSTQAKALTIDGIHVRRPKKKVIETKDAKRPGALKF